MTENESYYKQLVNLNAYIALLSRIKKPCYLSIAELLIVKQTL